MRHLVARALVVAGLTLNAVEARSQALDPAAADTLFRDGRRAADQGDFETACSKFEASLRIDPAPGTLFNLAHCEEKLGRVASAWTHYREVIPQLPTEGDDRRPYAEQRAAELEPRVARLTLRAKHPPPGIVVLRDDVALDPAAFETALPLDAGPHVITVKLAGHADARVEIAIAEGEVREVSIAVGPALPPPPRSRERSPALGRRDTAPAGPSVWVPRTGWTLVGLGAAGAVVGTAAGIVVLGEKSTYDDNCSRTFACNPEGRAAAERGTRWGTVSTVSFVAAGVALGAGTIVLIANVVDSKPKGKPAAPRRLGLGASF